MSSCISSKSSDDGPIEIQWLVSSAWLLFVLRTCAREHILWN